MTPDDPDNGRRDKVLEVAARVIARRGRDEVRLRDVAKEAGVSIGLIQHYFDTRDQMCREALAVIWADRDRRIADASASAKTSWERIQIYLEVALEWKGLTERARAWVDIMAAASRDGGFKRQVSDGTEAWRSPVLAAIEEGIANGDLDPIVEPEAAADAIVALVEGTEARLVAEDRDDSGSIERSLNTILLLARHMLAPVH